MTNRNNTAIKLLNSTPKLKEVVGLAVIFKNLIETGVSFTKFTPNRLWHESVEEYVVCKKYEHVNGVYVWRLLDSFWDSELFSNFEKQQKKAAEDKIKLYEEKIKEMSESQTSN